MRPDEIYDFSNMELSGIGSLFKKLKKKAKKLKRAKVQLVMPDETITASNSGIDVTTNQPASVSTFDTYKTGVSDMLKNPIIILIPAMLFLAYTMRPERKGAR
jgi:hypothetical protein